MPSIDVDRKIKSTKTGDTSRKESSTSADTEPKNKNIMVEKGVEVKKAPMLHGKKINNDILLSSSASIKCPPLPPKPIPFGSSVASANVRRRSYSYTKDSTSNVPSRSSSASSREQLKQAAREAYHRRSLTQQEHLFLENLVIGGDDVELSIAFERLSDRNLFFDPSSPSNQPSSAAKGSSSGKQSDDTSISNNNDEYSNKSNAGNSTVKDGGREEIFRDSFRDTNTSFGSEKRKQYLEERLKLNMLHDKMWKAHENGIAVTNGASRKSIRRRTNSNNSFVNILKDIEKRDKLAELVRDNSFLSTATQDLVMTGGPTDRLGENEIFRDSVKSNLTTSSVSHNSSNSISKSNHNRVLSGGTLQNVAERPTLRRLRSEEPTRKSVTFKHDTKSPFTAIDEASDRPQRRLSRGNRGRSSTLDDLKKLSRYMTPDGDDDGLFPPLQHGHSIRSDSLSSIPSIHHGHPIRADSLSSIPSIHHGRPIRSDSLSSIPSIHHGRPIRSDSVSSIPSIHHAHPLRSDSISSIPSIHHGRPIRSDSVSSIPYSIASTNFSPRSSDAQTGFDDYTVEEIFRQDDKEDTKHLNVPAWSSQLTVKEPLEEERVEDPNPAADGSISKVSESDIAKPILLRETSQKSKGEGIEVVNTDEIINRSEGQLIDSIETARRYRSMLSVGDLSCNSFDETKSVDRNRSTIFRDSISRIDMELSDMLLNNQKSLLIETSSTVDLVPEDDDASWTMDSDIDHYDAWDVFKDEYAVGYGVGSLPFFILGTSADDVSSQPHVLSPPLMESLYEFFPYSVSEDNFYMKYSLIRDGASLYTLLQKVRGSPTTIVAVETSDGEVFGSFTSATWRKNWKYFGNGESFLWRMRQSRNTPCHSIIDQAHLESELDVYPWTGENNCIQLCTHDRIAVGGGMPSPSDLKEEVGDDRNKKADNNSFAYGFGLAIDSDLQNGTSDACMTFGSPPLSKSHADGSKFEIVNLEVWTLTPCISVEEAEKLELSMLFLQNHK